MAIGDGPLSSTSISEGSEGFGWLGFLDVVTGSYAVIGANASIIKKSKFVIPQDSGSYEVLGQNVVLGLSALQNVSGNQIKINLKNPRIYIWYSLDTGSLNWNELNTNPSDWAEVTTNPASWNEIT